MIKQLSEQVTQDLCAQQVITSLTDCVKQLVDNAIDAGSTFIQVFLKEYGKKSVTVQDNGVGIESFDFLGKKGSTSKNKGKMEQISTLGFRGQALHSLAKVSEAMTITSTTSISNQTIQYNLKTNQIKSLETKRAQGTLVAIDSLFEYVPVRRYQLMSKFKQQLKKIDQLIKQYAIIFPSIAFILKNSREGKQDTIISASILQRKHVTTTEKWKYRIAQILTSKLAQALMQIESTHISGWILKNIESGSSRDNNFIRKNIFFMYLNKRPIDPIPKIQHALNQIYKKYNKNTKYVYILNLVLPFSNYDVNLAPNKRQILIKENLLAQIIVELNQFVSKHVVEEISELQDFKLAHQKQRMSNQFNNYFQSKNQHEQRDFKKEEIKKQEINFQSKGKVQIKNSIKTKVYENFNKQQNPSPEAFNSKVNNSLLTTLNERMSKGKIIKNIQKPPQKKQQQCIEKKEQNNQILFKTKIYQTNNQEKEHLNQKVFHQKSEVQSEQKQKNQIKINLNEKMENKKQQKKGKIGSQNKTKQNELNNQNFENSWLEKRIKRTIKKQEFSKFEILGQFNRGFIVCFHEGNFYLIDQHAASEKAYFQNYMSQSRNKTQLNIKISLTPLQQEKLQENQAMIEEQGYQYIKTSDDEIVLTMAPTFLGKVYGKQYFMEVLDKEQRLENIHDYYMAAASKACRKAVMVGDALKKSEIEKIIKQLSELQSPWNCPHGRPTLISLGEQNEFCKEKDNECYSLI